MPQRYFEKKDRPRAIMANCVLLFTNIAALSYFNWFFHHVIWSFYAVIYIFAELVCLLHINLTVLSYRRMRFHRRHPPLKGFDPKVDVFVTCCGEDLNIIRKTLTAAVAINYSNKIIYVLDDRKSPELKKLAQEMGCVYITRESGEYYKAGNLNNGMKHSSGEFILALDADQVSRPYIIKKLIGYFIRPEIAFVQSPQSFDLPKNDPYNSEDRTFNKSVEISKDADNAVISCGSGVVYRRSALDAIGGFSTWNLVEDLHTSYILQQKGYVGIFFNYALTKGLAPPHYAAVARQRHKWTTDTLRLFLWDNPLFKKGLSINQKAHYFGLGVLYLFSGFCIPIFLILPIWSLLSNSFVVNQPASEFLLFRLPYFGFMIILDNFVFRSKGMIKVNQTWNSFFPIFMQAAIDAFCNKRLKMAAVVTLKNEPKEKGLPWYCTVNAQMTILFLYVLSLGYSVWAFGINRDIFFGNCIWMIWSAFLIAPMTINVFLEQHDFILHAGHVSPKTHKVLNTSLCVVLFALVFYYVAPADMISSWPALNRSKTHLALNVKSTANESMSSMPKWALVPIEKQLGGTGANTGNHETEKLFLPQKPLTVAEKYVKLLRTSFSLTPMFSMYWQDTSFIRINEGVDLKVKSSNGRDTFGIVHYFSDISGDNTGHINRDTLKASYLADLNKQFSLYVDAGVNSYSGGEGESFTGIGRVVYHHDSGNMSVEFSHYDIIDTVDLFTPRYYTLVTNAQAAIHKISTNDMKYEVYQSFGEHWAFYANAVYGMYSDDNIKRTAYLSPRYILNENWNIKYGFAYIDVSNPSPYYDSFNNTKVHQLALEYTKPLTRRLSLDAENTVYYDMTKGAGNSIFTGFKYKIKDNVTLDTSLKYSYSDNKPYTDHISSLGATCSVKIDF